MRLRGSTKQKKQQGAYKKIQKVVMAAEKQ